MTPRASVIFSGKCENLPDVDMVADVLAAAGPLAMSICEFLETDCGTPCTERGVGFGEWDVGFLSTGVNAGEYEIPMVLARFNRAWRSGLFRVAVHFSPS